jgi:hypothetical protein
MSAHDKDYVDDNENMTLINRHIATSKSLFDSRTAAASALVVTTAGIYEMSVISKHLRGCHDYIITTHPTAPT